MLIRQRRASSGEVNAAMWRMFLSGYFYEKPFDGYHPRVRRRSVPRRRSGMYGQTPELGDVRNVAPKTRADRNAALHREDLEKSRLRARREGYYRHAIDR